MSDPNQPPPYQQPSYPPPNQASNPSPSYPQSAPQSYSPPPPPSSYDDRPSGAPTGTVPGRTLGIVALIGSIVLSFFSLVWLILGIVALVKSRKAGAKNGFAVAAIIISIVAFIVWAIVAVVSIVGIVTVAQLCAEYGSGVYEINGNPVTLTCG